MQMDAKGLGLLKKWEGSSNTVYKDSSGYPTIGVGHLLTKAELSSGKIVIGVNTVKTHLPITEDQIVELLAQDLVLCEKSVNTKVKVKLSQNQFNALVSFAFNVGTPSFEASTLLKVLNNGYYDQVPIQLRRWNKSGGKVVQGLINRRENEIALFVGEL